MIRDIQKCIHVINQYGVRTEKEVIGHLRSLTWEQRQSQETYEILDNIIDDYLIRTANFIKQRFSDKDDWYMQDDPDLHVYEMGDSEWWVSDLSIEETIKCYIEEYGDEISIDEVSECDIDTEGMFWHFENQPETDMLIKHLLGGENYKKITNAEKEIFLSNQEDYAVWVPFRRAIELQGKYIKPYMIATSEY